mmetsp:Transcript_46284/g.94371  ORF Transcript_46284/g.94371 Transcript_46284/m.94371 type:complete len:236 (+) Transcript_46284:40-747(+)
MAAILQLQPVGQGLLPGAVRTRKQSLPATASHVWSTERASPLKRIALFSQTNLTVPLCASFGCILSARRRKQPTARGAMESDLADLEAQLRLAVEAEDYKEAARLRDLLQMQSFDAETGVLSANNEFYAAFRAGSAERMSKIWLPSPRSCCVHPGRPPVNGYEDVAMSWERILTCGGLDIECTRPLVAMCGSVGRIVCYERVDGQITLLAVNLFEQTEDGWKMSFHQASPVVPTM